MNSPVCGIVEIYSTYALEELARSNSKVFCCLSRCGRTVTHYTSALLWSIVHPIEKPDMDEGDGKVESR